MRCEDVSFYQWLLPVIGESRRPFIWQTKCVAGTLVAILILKLLGGWDS